MKKHILFNRKMQRFQKDFLAVLLLFLGTIAFGQTVTPTKIVTQNSTSCGLIDVEINVIGANPMSKPLEVVLVLDISGSMTSGSPDTSMDFAKDAAIDFINKIFLPTNNPTGLNKVALVSYSTTATINQPLTLASGKTGLINVVNGLIPNGFTNIQDGIVKADNELTAHGTFNCNTSRSIILLTDGVANRTGTNGATCSGGTSGSCIQSAISAANNAKTNIISGITYTNQIFSVGLFGGISGSAQTEAQYCLNNIQSGGAFFTENAANLMGIYTQILNQISWVATQIPGTSFHTETVNADFNIVPGSITVTKGSFTLTGQIIKWNIDFLNSETITLKYKLIPKPTICGNSTVSSTRLDYLNSNCLVATQNVVTPSYCVPCPPILSSLPDITTITCSVTPNFVTPSVVNSCGSASLNYVDIIIPGICTNSYSIKRTWTATNSCYSTSASQTIIVQDVTAPIISPLPAVSNINCPTLPSFATPTATDSCGGLVTLTFSDTTTPGNCSNNYSITRTWTAKDSCNNTSTASQTINVQDVTAPIISPLPAVSTINCPALPSFAVATATDSCGGLVTLTYSDTTTPGTCAGNYLITRTWTAKDSCNNTSTASQTINVQDVTAPVISTLPAASTINCPALPSFATPTATDSCGGLVTLTYSDTTTPGSCANNYSIIRTWTAKDSCNNTSTASQTINMQDITSPIISPLPAVSTINCPAVPSFATATASDGCGGLVPLTYSDTTTPGSCPNNYSITRTWTAKDVCNNTSTASQTIYMQDVTAPVISPLPAVSTINCPAVPSFATPTATDSCSGLVTLTYSDTTTPGTCPNNYSITRTWTAKDVCNNTSTASQTINVQDVTAPVISPLPAVSTINCPAVPSFATPTATDSCGGLVTLTFSDTTTPGTCANNYSTTRTWTAKDVCNNTSTASQTINMQDVTAPVISPLPATSTINCPAVPSFVTPTTSDGCGGLVTLTFSDTITPGTCANNYSNTRTWTAKDSCNNTSTASQTINMQDVTAPVISTLPAVSTINCPAVPSFATPTATDSCGGLVTLTFSDTTTPGTCANNYSTTRTWTAKDSCINTSTASQTIIVQDVTAPVISQLPAVSTINCPTLPSFATPTATDSCGGLVILTYSDTTTPGTCTNNYSITRTWTAKDGCNNTSTASQTINVQDVTAPNLTIQATNLTLECDGLGNLTQLNNWLASNGGASALDDCSEVSWTNNFTGNLSDLCGLTGIATVSFTASDACGNNVSSIGTFTILDTTPPSFTSIMPENISVSCDAIPTPQELTGTDSCSTEVFITTNDEISSTPSECIGQFQINRTWKISDSCGNFQIHRQIISVFDNTPPLLVTPFPNELFVNCSAIPPVPNLEFTDNCSGINPAINYTETITTQSISEYLILRNWIVSDNCGNTSNFSQNIHVTVTEPFDAIPYRICITETIDLFTLLPNGLPTNGNWIEVNTTGAISGSNFDPSGLAFGYYTIRYVVTTENNSCPSIYEIYIRVANCEVLAACDIIVYNAVSPNGDGLNEVFMIEGITCYPNNTVEIYNRWGAKIYTANGYNNNSISFNGMSQNKLTLGNDKLPGDTYFYILNYKDAQNNAFEKTGYLYIKY